jgi:hypothetical protein
MVQHGSFHRSRDGVLRQCQSRNDFGIGNRKLRHVTLQDISDYHTVEFRGEFFNIFNHPNFSGVQTSVGAGNYGRLTAARDRGLRKPSCVIHFEQSQIMETHCL